MRRVLVGLLVAGVLACGLLVLGGFGIGPVVITREDEQKVILMLGSPRSAPTEPGVSLRWPLLEEVKTFDRRWLHLSTEPKEIQTLDRERIVVDHYAIWRIKDPLLFYESFPTGQVEAETQIDQQVRARVREVIGQRTLSQVLKESRAEIMKEITGKVNDAVERFGIEVGDVRINRTELPPRTEESVYARMRAERDRLARKHRAEGEEQARTIRAQADRESQVIVAEARGRGEVERGHGDAEAARIYAEAYAKDAEFYAFIRSLQAYEKALRGDTTLVLSPEHPFFRYLQGASGGGSGGR